MDPERDARDLLDAADECDRRTEKQAVLFRKGLFRGETAQRERNVVHYELARLVSRSVHIRDLVRHLPGNTARIMRRLDAADKSIASATARNSFAGIYIPLLKGEGPVVRLMRHSEISLFILVDAPKKDEISQVMVTASGNDETGVLMVTGKAVRRDGPTAHLEPLFEVAIQSADVTPIMGSGGEREDD